MPHVLQRYFFLCCSLYFLSRFLFCSLIASTCVFSYRFLYTKFRFARHSLLHKQYREFAAKNDFPHTMQRFSNSIICSPTNLLRYRQPLFAVPATDAGILTLSLHRRDQARLLTKQCYCYASKTRLQKNV